ncbi:MAG: hypothetical protein AABX85_03175 [Nanoarchaeota archaeon]
MTYGWAILIAIIAIGVLAYYGVFSPGKLVSDKFVINQPFSPEGAVVTSGLAGTAKVEMEIYNGAGEQLTISRISISGCGDSDGIPNAPTTVGATAITGAGTAAIAANVKSGKISMTCTSDVAQGAFRGDVVVTYTKTGSALDLQSSGSITAQAK